MSTRRTFHRQQPSSLSLSSFQSSSSPQQRGALLRQEQQTTLSSSFPRKMSISPTISSTRIMMATSNENNNNNNNNNNTKKKSSSSTSNNSKLDGNMRTKLVSESIAPWRVLRLFFYGGLGTGALIGGSITLSGTIAAMTAGGGISSISGEEVNLKTEFLNLGIDFGAVLIFALLARYDINKQSELDIRVEERLEQKKERTKTLRDMKEREKQIGNLKLNVQVSVDGTTRTATIRELQLGAKQHMIIIAGPKRACKDALIGANLLKMDFAMNNVLVVPYETERNVMDDIIDGSGGASGGGGGTGFGERPKYETQPYVARASKPETTDDDDDDNDSIMNNHVDLWDEYISAEMKDAVIQNGEKAKEEGIVIVIANNGKIIRRGVGKVPWRQMVQQLEESVKNPTTTTA